MLNIAHLRRVYRDVDGMMSLMGEAEVLLDHYYPDFDAVTADIGQDSNWISLVAHLTGQEDEDDEEGTLDSVEASIEWGLTWATYALGPDLVRSQLKDHSKPWLAALAVAGCDPEMYMSGRRRAPLGQWLGHLIGTYGIHRRALAEEQLEVPLSEDYAVQIALGFIAEHIHDKGLRKSTTGHAMAIIRGIFSQVEAIHFAMDEETFH